MATAVWRAMPSAIVMSRCVNEPRALRRANSMTPKKRGPLDNGASSGRDISSLKRAVVSGAAFPPSLQAEIKARGIDAGILGGSTRIRS